MKRYLRNRRALVTLAVVFAFFLVLYIFLPYADDDWDWGTQGGLDRLFTGFADYNGRYAGNLLILTLTRVPLLKALVPALCMTLLCAFPAALCGGGVGALLAGTALMLCLSQSLARETLLWLSGFANYALGTLFLLLILYGLDRSRDATLTSRQQAQYALGAFIGSLFMEHITVCLVFVTLTVFLARFIRERRISRFALLLFAACALGAFTMFSNGAYMNIFAQQDFYRTLARPRSVWELLSDDCYKAYYYILYPNLVRDHPLTLSALGLSCVMLYIRRKDALPPSRRFLSGISCAFLCLLGFYLCAHALYPQWEPLLSFTYPAELLASLFVPIALLSLIFLLAPASSRPRMALEVLSILFLCAPLFVIAPVSARNFFPTYALTCVLCVEFLYAALDDRLDHAVLPFACVAAVAGALWLSVTVRNFFADLRRVQAAQEASVSQAQEVILPQLPCEEYMWNATPGAQNEMTKGYFRLFYGLRDDLALNIVDYQTYYRMKNSSDNTAQTE